MLTRLRIKAPLAALASVLLALTLTAACGSSSSRDANSGDTSVRASYAPTSAWLPVVLAADKGIFTKHGLNVTLTKIQNVDTAIGALDRQFDIIGETPTGVLQAAARGIDIKVAAGNSVETSDNQQLGLLVKADSPIRSIADLEGKTIGAASLTGATHIATLKALKDAGVDPKSIRTVETGFANMGDQLKAGTLDAVENVQPFTGALLKAGAVRNLGDPLMNVSSGKPISLTLWATNGKWAQTHAAQIKSWIDSLTEAVTYIEQHPDEARQVLQQFTGLPPEVSKALPLPKYGFTIDAAAIQVWIDVSKEVGQNMGSVTGAKLVVGP